MAREDDSFFLKAFGGSPMIRVIDFLVENRLYDCTKADIVEGAKVSRPTLEKIWPILVKSRMLRETRRIGNGVLYVLDTKNPAVKKILELDAVLTEMGTEKLLSSMEKAPVSA